MADGEGAVAETFGFSRPVMFFAGIWREWAGDRGTKAEHVNGKHLLFGFLTTEASPDVAPIHAAGPRALRKCMD